MNYRIVVTPEIIQWLLKGDVSIQFQVHRDLLGQLRPDLQNRIVQEGWGHSYLSRRKDNGHWGDKFYQPKWISSHYTLLDLRNLEIEPAVPLIRESLKIILDNEKGPDGGILPIGKEQKCDVCLNGMFLNYASYFRSESNDLQSIVDFILSQIMQDGGFNCQYNRCGAKHSSLHSTLSVLEGFTEFKKNGYKYRMVEIDEAIDSSLEFILQHQLYISDRTGNIIKRDFLKFPYPSRWKYDVLRALDYFQYSGIKWDERMRRAIEILIKKRNKHGTWNQYAPYAGKTHFIMEPAGKPGRWNTLRALRVLKHFDFTQISQN